MWPIDDITRQWLKVRNGSDRVYFIPWKQDPDLVSLDVLSVIPSDPAESASLVLTIPVEYLPSAEQERVVSPALRCEALARLWSRERSKLENQGSVEPMSAWIQDRS